jgi:hypothetical protein
MNGMYAILSNLMGLYISSSAFMKPATHTRTHFRSVPCISPSMAPRRSPNTAGDELPIELIFHILQGNVGLLVIDPRAQLLVQLD